MDKYRQKTTIYLDRKLKKRAQKYAVENDMTFSRLIYITLRDFLDNEEEKEAKRIKGPPHPDQQLSDLMASQGLDIYEQPWNFVSRPKE